MHDGTDTSCSLTAMPIAETIVDDYTVDSDAPPPAIVTPEVKAEMDRAMDLLASGALARPKAAPVKLGTTRPVLQRPEAPTTRPVVEPTRTEAPAPRKRGRPAKPKQAPMPEPKSQVQEPADSALRNAESEPLCGHSYGRDGTCDMPAAAHDGLQIRHAYEPPSAEEPAAIEMEQPPPMAGDDRVHVAATTVDVTTCDVCGRTLPARLLAMHRANCERASKGLT